MQAADFDRSRSPASYCRGPVMSHPGIPECSGTHTCRKAELFTVHFNATTGLADFIGPIYSKNTMNNCIIGGSPNTVAGMISSAANNCQKERVLRVYLPIQ